MVAAALGGSALLGAGTSLFGASEQSSAAQQAAQYQYQAQMQAIQEQQREFNFAKGQEQPFVNAGQAGIGQLEALLGIGKGGSAGIQTALNNLPGYQFSKQQGQQAINTSTTASGLGLSSAQARALSQFNTGNANQAWQSYVSPLMNLVGMGGNAAAGEGNQAIQTGQGIANSYSNSGNALAGGAIGAGNAWAAGASNVGNAFSGGLTNYTLYSQLFGGGLPQGVSSLGEEQLSPYFTSSYPGFSVPSASS